jgi:hypothetical protein
MWLDLFFALVEQLALGLLAIWLVFWLVIAAPRLVRHESLAGSLRQAWDSALPFGGLAAIILIGRAVLAWTIQ